MYTENKSSETPYSYKEFEVIYEGTEALLEDATSKVRQIVHNHDEGTRFLERYSNTSIENNTDKPPFPPYTQAAQAIDSLKAAMVQNILNNPYLSASLNNDPEQVKKYYIITGIPVRIVNNILDQLENNNSQEKSIMMEIGAEEWKQRIEGLISKGSHIITFRGAGTVNGINPESAEKATSMIVDYVSQITESKTPVVLMFDGDEDNRLKPDIGSIFGSVVDAFQGNKNITAITAQSKGWYSPKTDGAPLETATGNKYETYVFPDDMPGGHSALTQSEDLVSYSGYEQIFVGPAGPIAFDQLIDLSSKTANRSKEYGPIKIYVLQTTINRSLDSQFINQLNNSTDEQTKQKIESKISQRNEKPYGAMFDKYGSFVIDANQFPGIDFDLRIL